MLVFHPRDASAASLQSLLDFVFVLLCQANPDRHRQLAINLERIHHLLES